MAPREVLLAKGEAPAAEAAFNEALRLGVLGTLSLFLHWRGAVGQAHGVCSRQPPPSTL